MTRWREWYIKRQIKLTNYAAQEWDVWVCGHCNRAVSTDGVCFCASRVPPLPRWEDVT